MKRLIATTVLALGLAGAAQADPALGIWQTQVDDGSYAHIKMVPCGNAVCGTIDRTFNSSVPSRPGRACSKRRGYGSRIEASCLTTKPPRH